MRNVAFDAHAPDGAAITIRIEGEEESFCRVLIDGIAVVELDADESRDLIGALALVLRLRVPQ